MGLQEKLNKCKLTTGQNMYTREEKLAILQRFYESGLTINKFAEENRIGHCTLPKWMAIFAEEKKKGTFLSNSVARVESMEKIKQETESLKVEQLQLEIERLNKELEYEKLKSVAYST
ncbi:MAG: hypothetical protein GX664_02830, partial [Bacteroidales bacterium]|nr:hypothetical protein [Bacteroidales bacterium]